MALAAANLEHLRLAINELKVGQEPPNDFPRRPEVLINHGIIPDDEDKQDVELEDLANLLTPYDVVNWKLWSKHFWAAKHKPMLDSLRMPRFAIINIESADLCRASTQLRQYEKAFQQWSDGVVAIPVYADMRDAALRGDLAEMSRLYRHVKEMMRGRHPVDLYRPDTNGEETDDEETDEEATDDEEADDEGDGEHQSDGGDVEELTDVIGKLKFGLDADKDARMV